MAYKFFDKKSASLTDISVSSSGINIPLEFNEELAKELHKPIIKKLKRIKIYSGFRDNIWGADLADMQLISKFNKGYGIGFDRRGSFSFPGGGFGQNILIFGVDMSFSAHIDNKKKIY